MTTPLNRSSSWQGHTALSRSDPSNNGQIAPQQQATPHPPALHGALRPRSNSDPNVMQIRAPRMPLHPALPGTAQSLQQTALTASQPRSAAHFAGLCQAVEEGPIEHRAVRVGELAQQLTAALEQAKQSREAYEQLDTDQALATCHRLLDLLKPIQAEAGSAQALAGPMHELQQSISATSRHFRLEHFRINGDGLPTAMMGAVPLMGRLANEVIQKHGLQTDKTQMVALLERLFVPKTGVLDPVAVEIMTGCFMLPTQLERLNAGAVSTEDLADMLAAVAEHAQGENGLRNLGAATDVVSRWSALQGLIRAALAKHDVDVASFERLQRAMQALDAGPPADVLAAAAAEVEAATVAEVPVAAVTAS